MQTEVSTAGTSHAMSRKFDEVADIWNLVEKDVNFSQNSGNKEHHHTKLFHIFICITLLVIIFFNIL